MILNRIFAVAITALVAGCSDSPVISQLSIVDELEGNKWRVDSISSGAAESVVIESEFQFTATFYNDSGIPLMLMDFGCPAFLVQYSKASEVIKNEPLTNLTKNCTQEQSVQFKQRLLFQNFFNKSTLIVDTSSERVRLFDVDNNSVVLSQIVDMSTNEDAIAAEIRERHWVLRSYRFADGTTGAVDDGLPLSLYLAQSDINRPYSGLQRGTIACVGSFNYLNTQSDIIFSTSPVLYPPCTISSEYEEVFSGDLALSLVRILDSARWRYVFSGDGLSLQSDKDDLLVFDIATVAEVSVIVAATSTRFQN